MKRAIYVLMAIAMSAGTVGCCIPNHGCVGGLTRGSCAVAPDGAAACGCCNGEAACGQACNGNGQCDGSCHGDRLLCKMGCCDKCCSKKAIGSQGEAFQAGPGTAGVVYPYYTTRGPRDFLASNPRSIGP